MPREAKPYVERGWYISRAGGRYLKLCPVSEGMTEVAEPFLDPPWKTVGV